MNKKLVAVAIAGLLAAPLAQAQTANVTLYGRLNIDMEFVNGRLSNNTNPNIYRVVSNSSRFGLRGVESLGGGLNAIFQIENGSINAVQGGGNLGGRDTFVGLSGGWGTFKMGRFLAPYDDIHGIFGNDNTAIDVHSVDRLGVGAGLCRPAGERRLRRSPAEVHPLRHAVTGWASTAAAQFSTNGGTSGPGNTSNPSSNSNSQSYGVFVQQRPVHRRCRLRIPPQQRGTGALPLSDWAFSVAAKWQFSGFNIAGVYEKMEYEVQNGPGTLANPFVRNKLKRNSFWAVDSTINVGANGQVFLYYGQASDGKGSAVNTPAPIVTPNAVIQSNISRVAGLAKGSNTGATHWEVSYSYDLSKRTRVYTGYVKINNDSNASYNFNINAYPGSANTVAGGPVGMNLSGFVMGMYHNF